MNWLNKLDDVLDNTFLRANNNDDDDDDYEEVSDDDEYDHEEDNEEYDYYNEEEDLFLKDYDEDISELGDETLDSSLNADTNTIDNGNANANENNSNQTSDNRKVTRVIPTTRNRPGMILSVVRDDVSDSDDGSESNSSNDGSEAQSSLLGLQVQGSTENYNISINTHANANTNANTNANVNVNANVNANEKLTGEKVDDKDKMDVVYLTNQLHEQISPIASPRLMSSIRQSFIKRQQQGSEMTAQEGAVVPPPPPIYQIHEGATSTPKQTPTRPLPPPPPQPPLHGLPSLPMLVSERSQSVSTVPTSNIQTSTSQQHQQLHATVPPPPPLPLQTISRLPPPPPPPPPRPPRHGLSLPPIQKINLDHDSPRNDSDEYNTNSHDDGNNDNQLDVVRNNNIIDDDDQIENNTSLLRRSSSYRSDQTDIIQNTSTLSSFQEMDDYYEEGLITEENEDYMDKFDKYHNNVQQNASGDDRFIDDDTNGVDNQNLQDEKTAADVEVEIETKAETESTKEIVSPITKSTMKVFQATVGDYLFSQNFVSMGESGGFREVETEGGHNESSMNDSYSIEDSTYEEEDSVKQEVEDYEINTPLCPWNQDGNEEIQSGIMSSSSPTFNSNMNCHGIVHLKLLRIQHLPVNPGNSLEAVISLPPWKGRIRSKKIKSYIGPSKAGVCARWDKKIQKKNASEGDDNSLKDDISIIQDELSQSHSVDKNSSEITCHSMVHTYNNEDTPIPTISIELKGLTLQMFKRDICSFTISCEPLMRKPGVFHRRWCVAGNNFSRRATKKTQKQEINVVETENKDIDLATSPLILVEACFEPTEFGGTKATSTKSSLTLNTSLLSPKEKNVNSEEILSQPRERADTLDSFESLSNKRLTTKPHLFRVNTDWRPTNCAVCSSIIFRKGYRCESCKLDCCVDCQLRVDVELPCGSAAARMIVDRTLKSKLTVSKIYSIIAPVKKVDIDEQKGADDLSIPIRSLQVKDNETHTAELRGGIGTFKLRIIKACLFQRSFPPEAEISHILENSDRWLRGGDHYARVSWSGSEESKRTKVVFQTARPAFNSEEMSITAMHYGTEFRIEVLDASTDASVGSTLVTSQGLLQWQRDQLASEGGLTLSSIISQEPIHVKKRKTILELRTGVKSGFGLDFYKAEKLSGSTRAGEISGWVEVELCFEEDPEIHSNSNPRPCPLRPNSDFNMELIQLHIARIFSLLEEVNELVGVYIYLISWKNPALTSLSLIIFVVLCLRFNTEYFGSLPIAFLIAYMLYLWSKRSKGYRVYLQKKERIASLKEMKGATVQYQGHRPTGTLKIGVVRGQHLSPQLGLGIPGSLVAHVIWDPTKFLDEKSTKKIVDFDASSKSIYHVGETESSAVTFNPEWKAIHSSDQLQRLKQLLPSTNFLSRTNSDDTLMTDNGESIHSESQNSLEVPILQPIIALRHHVEREDESDEEEENSERIDLIPWEESKGAIVVQVRFTDVLNKLPIFDQILGEVVIPFDKVVKNKVDSWFQVLPKGTMDTVEEFPDNEPEDPSNKSFLTRLTDPDDETISKINKEAKDTLPRIHIKAEFEPPNGIVTDIDRETSIVVAEHMIWSASATTDNRPGFIGSSLETFNTVRGVTGQVQYLQNQLGIILDVIETLRNTFNFTCPEKSAFVLIGLVILWFLFALLPTSFVVLCAGLGQYLATLMRVIKSNNKTNSEQKELENLSSEEHSNENNESYNPVLTRIKNFFMSIPTNEDLRRYYFWEARKVGDREREIWAAKKRTGRLTKLYQAQWFGRLELKTPNVLAPTDDGRLWDWITIFAIIQGHRFIWWRSEKDFDDGENPSGQLFFAGHSGLAGLSPLELRELKKHEIEKVVNIFGRGGKAKGQLKISLLVQDRTLKESLETAVLNATLDGKIE